MNRRLFATLAVLVGTAALTLTAARRADAQSCRAVGSVYTPTAVVATPAVAVVATPVFVPVFSAFYAAGTVGYGAGVYGAQAPAAVAGQPAAAAQAPARQQQDAVLEYLKKLDARMTAIEKRLAGQQTPAPADGGPVMPPADGGAGGGQALTLAGVYAKSCVACHEDKKAAREGGGLVLVKDGAVVAQPGDKVVEIIKRTREGSMPPRKNKYGIQGLSDAEFSALVEGLTK